MLHDDIFANSHETWWTCTDGVYWMRLSELRRRRTEPQRRQRCSAATAVDNDDELTVQTQSTQSGRRREDDPETSPTTSEKLVSASYVRSAGASSIRAKRRSVQMLTVVVVLFFVCWTPMYVMQTWSVFDYDDAVAHVSPIAMNYIHLLAFVSSCCNPITYCFMSAKFRQGFVDAFRCRRRLGRGNSQLGHPRLDSVRHHDMGTTRSMLATTRVNRATVMTSAGTSNEQDVIVSHRL